MIRLGFNTARISSSIINGARRCIEGHAAAVTASEPVNVNNIDNHEGGDSARFNQTKAPSDLTSAAELKARNNEGFFDNNIVLTGVAGKCMYNIDDDNNVHAIRIPIRYKVKGDTKVITATAMRSDLITFLLNNVDEGVPICVRGTLGRPMPLRNFTINAKHVQILSTPVTDT